MMSFPFCLFVGLLSFCENGGPAEGVKVTPNWELQIKGTIGTTLIGSCE